MQRMLRILITTIALGVVSGNAPVAAEIQVAALQTVWTRVDRALPWPTPRILWAGSPLSAPRGIVQLGDALYVTDPGRPQDPGRIPRIVKFPLVNGVPGTPTVFFERPGFLFSAKWSVPAGGDQKFINALVVADQGEELPDGTFTGIGAKIFVLPILDDGSAGEPQVLWEGPPMVCPSGVVVADEVIYVTDPCAGPLRTRPERPQEPFVSSKFFALHFTGTPPITLWTGAPFASLIGICDVEHEDGLITLIIHDTDSGRLDPTEPSPRPGGFSPAAAAELWMFDILRPAEPVLSRPRRIAFYEEGPVTLQFNGLPARAEIRIVTLAGNTFPDSTPRRVFKPGDLRADGTLPLAIASPVELSNVMIEAEVVDPATGRRLAKAVIDLPKDPDQTTQFANNKHRGKVTQPAVTTGVQAAQSRAVHFTIDQTRATVWFFADGGGIPVSLAAGPPLSEPLSAQVSPDQSALWISDSAGALLSLAVPDFNTLESMFPTPFVKVCDTNGSGAVDRADINTIFMAIGSPAQIRDPRDGDGDKRITINDTRVCALGCIFPRCALEF